MRRLYLAIFAIGAAQSAFAADMPAKAPVLQAPAAVAPGWTGFYLNAGLGYGFGSPAASDHNSVFSAAGISRNGRGMSDFLPESRHRYLV
jgi:hypothetical protein